METLEFQLARKCLERTFRVELTFDGDQLIYARFRSGNIELEYEYERDTGLELLRILVTFDYTVGFNIWDIQWIDHFFDFLQRLMDEAVIVFEETEVDE